MEMLPATAGPDVVLWSWCSGDLDRGRLPDRRVLVRFKSPDEPKPRRRLWLLVDDGEGELCHPHPAFDEDLSSGQVRLIQAFVLDQARQAAAQASS